MIKTWMKGEPCMVHRYRMISEDILEGVIKYYEEGDYSAQVMVDGTVHRVPIHYLSPR